MRSRLLQFTAAATCALFTSGVQACEMSYGTSTLPTHPQIKAGVMPTQDRIATAADGELTFETFTGGAMCAPNELLGNIGSRSQHGGCRAEAPTTPLQRHLLRKE